MIPQISVTVFVDRGAPLWVMEAGIGEGGVVVRFGGRYEPNAAAVHMTVEQAEDLREQLGHVTQAMREVQAEKDAAKAKS